MTWLSVLSNTYDYLYKDPSLLGKESLFFRYTTIQPTWIISINSKGEFKGAREVPKKQYFVPCTDQSPARTSSSDAHPLCDNLQYVAGRYCQFFDQEYLNSLPENKTELMFSTFKKMNEYYSDYYSKLSGWCEWSNENDNNPFIIAVLKYITTHDVIADLISAHIGSITEEMVNPLLHLNDSMSDFNKFHESFKKLLKNFVSWEVADVSSDWSIISTNMCESWNNYYESLFNCSEIRYCVVSGIKTVPASGYPKKIRHEGDQAKLFSSNDKSGLTFRGRFVDSSETASISSSVSQKIHKALAWLMRNVQSHIEDQYTVVWTLGDGIKVPSFISDEYLELGLDDEKSVDVSYTDKVKEMLNGKLREIPATQKVYIMSVDSMSPGRLSVVFWEEIDADVYFNALLKWCNDLEICSSNGVAYIPKLSRLSFILFDKKPSRDFYNRMSNAILTSGRIPEDLMFRIYRKCLNPYSCDDSFGAYLILRDVASLIKACQIRNMNRSDVKMSLDSTCQDRSYLFGRLLAVADNIEKYVLNQNGEKRITTAMRLLQIYSERPAVTWKNIEKSIMPYVQRLYGSDSSVAFIRNRQNLIDQICSMFMSIDDFTSSKPLDPIFILGFHQQRCALYDSKQ